MLIRIHNTRLYSEPGFSIKSIKKTPELCWTNSDVPLVNPLLWELNADPNPGSQNNADPDPDPG